MIEYALYLESGPQRRKTMVHVAALLGCMANGPTTDEALRSTPDEIRTYLRFLGRVGEAVNHGEPFQTVVAEHITQGVFIGHGSSYITFGPDLEPLTDGEVSLVMARFHAMRKLLADWAEAQTDELLDARTAPGRTARAILLHVLGTPPAYLGAALGGVSGFSRVITAAERRRTSLGEALMTVAEMAIAVVQATTPEQRAAVVQRPNDLRTLRKAVRRTLEHDWEHLRELSRRPGGPAL